MGACRTLLGIPLMAFPLLFLSSAWGQIPIGGKMPQATLHGARWGLEADGRRTQTVVFLTNVAGGDGNGLDMSVIDPASTSEPNVQAKITVVTGTSLDAVAIIGGTNQFGVHRYTLDGVKPTDPAKDYWIELLGLPNPVSGFALYGLVQTFDPAGNMLSSTPILATTNNPVVPASVNERNFFFPLDIEPAKRASQTITFENPDPVAWTSATVNAFDPNPASANRKPFATVQVSIPPGGMSESVSKIFAGASGWNGGAFMDQSNPQSLLQVTTGFQCMDLSSTMLFANPDGSVVSTELEPLSSDPILSRPVTRGDRAAQGRDHIMISRPVRERWFPGGCR